MLRKLQNNFMKGVELCTKRNTITRERRQHMKQSVSKRLLALFLAVMMVIPLVTSGITTSYAAEGVKENTGSGNSSSNGDSYSTAKGDWKGVGQGYGYRFYPVIAVPMEDVKKGGNHTLTYDKYMAFRDLAVYECCFTD